MKEIKKEDILLAVKSMAEQSHKNWVSAKEFAAGTGISISKVLKYYDSWNSLILEAGLLPLGHEGQPISKGISEEQLLKMIRDVANKLGKTTLSQTEFCKTAGISFRPIQRVFGNWLVALEKAGLNSHPSHKTKIPDEDLIKEYFRINDELKRFPTYTEFARKSQFSIGVYENRFGNFTGFRKIALQHGIEHGLVTPELVPTFKEVKPKNEQESSYKALNDRPVFGEKIDYRGLLHAPINELGVVYLFGILSDELGFVVESIQAGFPDCEGKRKLKGNRWQRVSIEFEYKSSNFLLHKHDISGCDLIICWEHDWINSPLEVISLKEYVASRVKLG